jgi:hypothetical protein
MAEGRQDADPAESAYRAGDYAAARRAARKTAADESRPEAERERARRILRATGIDPWAVGVFLVTAAVIVYLVVRYVV